MRRMLLIGGACIALAACSEGAPDGGATATQAVETAAPPRSAEAGPGEGPAPVEVSTPQLAYSYSIRFVVPGDRISAAQEAHRALCERMGPARCQLLALERDGSGADGQANVARLELRVAAGEARAFQQAATRAVTEAGGRAADTKVVAEDVSKEIVDAEARIGQRALLVGRLTEILRTRQGSVGDLVAAERSVAQAQEELDQAKGWLAALRGRVAMSRFDIGYSAVAPTMGSGSFGQQLGEAVEASGATFLVGLRTLLVAAIFLAPWLLLAVPLSLWLRRRRRRQDVAPPQP